MKTSHSLCLPVVAAGAFLTLVSAFVPSADAAIVTWGGGDGEYLTGANWNGGSVPNTGAGDTAVINAGNVTYTPGGDLFIQNGGILQINGGSWTQAGGIAWIQMAGGTLNVAGGVFNQGTAGDIVKNASTVINVSGGTANFNGNLVFNSTATGQLNITGGTVNVANEFKPIETFNMTSGVLTAELISFADGPGSILFSGGLVSVNGAGGNSGFYGGGTKGLNFTTGSTGSLYFENYTITELNADGFLTNGTIQLNGVASAGSFNVFEQGGGVVVTLVPEPSVAALACAGLGTALFFRRRFRA
jgi:hypothetical protein